MMSAALKWLGITSVVFSYIVIAGVISILPVGAKLRRAMQIRNTSFFSRPILRVLGIRIHVKYPERLRANHHRGRLIVANHLSYTDIPVISFLIPSVFVTSIELGQTGLLGTLARFGGSLFVERRKPSGLKREIAAISHVLAEGFPVVLFAESTTSNGDQVQPFKNSLFDAAISSTVDILPVCLRYTEINGDAITSGNRDTVFYYGDETFFKHLPKLLSLKSVAVEVILMNTISAHAGTSRKELAVRAHDVISAAYGNGKDRPE